MSFEKIAKISPEQLDIINKLRDIDANLKIKWDDKIDAPSLIYGNLSVPHPIFTPKSALGFLRDIKGLLRIKDPTEELSNTIESRDRAGNIVYVFQQMYYKIPVEGSIVRVQYSASGIVSRVTNAYIPGINIDATPRVDADRALQSALSNAGPGWRASKKIPSLSIVSPEGVMYLVWKVTVDLNGRNPLVYYIKADDGKVLYRKNGFFNGSGVGYYCGTQNLNTTVGASSKHAGSTHKLIDSTRGYKITIYDLPKPYAEIIHDSGKVCAYLHLSDLDNHVSEDDDDNWTDTDPGRWEDQRPEVDLAYYFGQVADYFNGLGHRSFDGRGNEIKAAAHDGESFGCLPQYNEVAEEFYFGDGDGDVRVTDSRGVTYTNPDPQLASTPGDGKGMDFLTTKDIVAHEYTHAVICHTANFDKCPEGFQPVPGKCPKFIPCGYRSQNKFMYDKTACGQWYTLHEAIADIFAYLITGEPDMGKGVIKDPVYTCFRTLNDPADKHREDIFQKHSNHMRPGTDSLQKGYVTCHDVPLTMPFDPQINMGPVVYAGYLMVNGGTHPGSGIKVEKIQPIGNKTAGLILAELIYHSLTIGLPGEFTHATFLDFREAMLNAVESLYGSSGQFINIRDAVVHAFNAVGIGNFIIPPPPIAYDLDPFKWPSPVRSPDPLGQIGVRVHWPVQVAEPGMAVHNIRMRDYGVSSDIITLGSAGSKQGRQKETKGSRRKEFASIKLMNVGSEQGGVLVNLFACSPKSIGEPSGWKWIGASVVDNIKPGEEKAVKVAIQDKKMLAGLDGDNGEVCLIAQIDSSIDRSPFKARENLEKLTYIDLDNSEFICSRVKINS